MPEDARNTSPFERRKNVEAPVGDTGNPVSSPSEVIPQQVATGQAKTRRFFNNS